jgi:hypothetical protein
MVEHAFTVPIVIEEAQGGVPISVEQEEGHGSEQLA